MKDFSLLIWITQLGLSVAIPLAGCTLLSLWLRDRFGWPDWVLWVGVAFGIICAVDGLRTSLMAMERLTRGNKKQNQPPMAFNDHD